MATLFFAGFVPSFMQSMLATSYRYHALRHDAARSAPDAAYPPGLGTCCKFKNCWSQRWLLFRIRTRPFAVRRNSKLKWKDELKARNKGGGLRSHAGNSPIFGVSLRFRGFKRRLKQLSWRQCVGLSPGDNPGESRQL